MARRRLLAACLALLGLVGAGCAASPSQPRQVVEVSGEPTAWRSVDPVSVDLPGLRPVSPAHQLDARARSDVVLINIWASYCSFCVRELSMLDRADRRAGVTVIGISRDTSAQRALGPLSKASVEFANQLDPRATYLEGLGGVLPRNVLPVTALWADGAVRAVHIGPFSSYSDIVDGLSAG